MTGKIAVKYSKPTRTVQGSHLLSKQERGLKEAYATSQAKVVIYKNKLDGTMCAPAPKLLPMRRNILETGEIHDAELK